MSKNNIFGYFEGPLGQFTYKNPYLAEKTKGVGSFLSEVGQGLKNAWYNWTGQTEKTSAYQAMIEREDTAYQRAAEDMEKAGLSKFGGITQASSTSPDSSSDPITKSIQLASAILDLKGKQAGVAKTEAETGYIQTQNSYVNKQLTTYDQKFMADLLQTNMQTLYIEAQKNLTEKNTEFVAEKAIAEIQQMAAHTNLFNFQSDYYAAQKKLVDQQTGIASFERQIKQKDLEKYEYRFNMEVEKQAEAIAKSVAERNHMDYQDMLTLKNLAYRQLESDVLQYNFNYSKEHGVRTYDTPSRIFGLDLSQLRDQFQLPEQLEKILWSPIWNWF